MGRINTETTKRNSLYKRERNLDKSTNKLQQLWVCLEVLREQRVDCDVIEHFYEVELRHNKRLTKLVENQQKGE